MATADRLTIEDGGHEIELMRRAGEGVASYIRDTFEKSPVWVLVGPGNNGGDGYVVAKSLYESGWDVKIAAMCEPQAMKGAAREFALNWPNEVVPLDRCRIDTPSLVVDALFGAGLNKPLPEIVINLLRSIEEKRLPVVAIDIPSGVHGDTGESLGAILCHSTVTFFLRKPGHVLLPGKALCGSIHVVDIGIPSRVLDAIHPKVSVNHPDHWIESFPRPALLDHKYTRGKAIIVGGYPMSGAGRLAARACMRIGAGLTSVVVPLPGLDIYAGALESAVIGTYSSQDEFQRLIQDPRTKAYLIGPGGGVDDGLTKQVECIVAQKKPVVLDADAISVLARSKHAIGFEISGCRLYQAQKASRLCGGIVVLKGNDSIIAAPDGRTVVNENAPSTLATAGSGDVLSGLITGLLAQGMPSFQAACAAVWIHGAAARRFGLGLIAEDLPDIIPRVLADDLGPFL
jgi:ADP-dependent NAD(P)H-hydrate dehydratase / NAD(P)H-hydrate epimerase